MLSPDNEFMPLAECICFLFLAAFIYTMDFTFVTFVAAFFAVLGISRLFWEW